VDWKLGLLCPIYKNGDHIECKNYRGIAEATVGYKVFSIVLFRKVEPIVKENVGKYQCGFTTPNRQVTNFYLKTNYGKS
jgi:hypothetical protein